MDKEYIDADITLLQMIDGRIAMDISKAEAIIKSLKNVDEIIKYKDDDSSYTYTNTYLGLAVDHNNRDAVELLLKNGANPNFYSDTPWIDPLNDLQYLYENQDQNIRYEIQKLFFEYGADPNFTSPDEPEPLYDYVLWKVYNDRPDSDDEWENLKQFYKLLILYGGGGKYHYSKPELHDIDMSRIDDYDIMLYLDDDNYHVGGLLIDKDRNVYGEL